MLFFNLGRKIGLTQIHKNNFPSRPCLNTIIPLVKYTWQEEYLCLLIVRNVFLF